MISRECKKCTESGWCEYDMETDTIYPNDEGRCPERMAKNMGDLNLTEFAKEVHQNAVEHGWWEEERSEAEVRALIHSEWSEALEEARAGRPMEWYRCLELDEPCTQEECGNWCKGKCMFNELDAKPEGIAVELMDGVIRILDCMARDGTADAAEIKRPSRILNTGREVAEASVGEIVDWLHYLTAIDLPYGCHPGYREAIAVCFEWVRAKGLDPEKIIMAKHRYNKTRPYKHGKRF